MKKYKILGIASIGAGLELYDFVIYGIFSAYMSESFFPKSASHIGLHFVYMLLIYGVGYIARPIGGLLFGNISDKRGRKPTFTTTLTIMAVATALVGFLPTYSQIGIMSSIFLLCLRIIQGISMGAELGVSCVYVYEQLSLGKNVFYGAAMFGLANFGYLFGSGLNALFNTILNHHQMYTFGWRIPFILGSIAGVIAIYIRSHADETKVFVEMEKDPYPVRLMLTKYKPAFIKSIITSFAYGISVNFGFVLMFSLLEQVYHLPTKTMALLTFIPTVLFCFTDLVIGAIADKFRIQLKKLFLVGAINYALSLFCVLYFYSQKIYSGGLLSTIWLTIAVSCFDTAIPNILPRLFPKEVCCSGVASGYAFGLAFAGLFASIASVFFVIQTLPIWGLSLVTFIIQIAGYSVI